MSPLLVNVKKFQLRMMLQCVEAVTGKIAKVEWPALLQQNCAKICVTSVQKVGWFDLEKCSDVSI